MAIQSKLAPIPSTCIQYVHPWTDSCTIATAGLILQAAQDSFRIYSAVYTMSLLMRCRIPKAVDLKRTVQGIIQSTAFLTTSAFSYCFFLCIIRRFFRYNFFTVSYVPAFMSSVCALLIERPSRRGLLSLYVSNVATETLFNMAVSRGMVTPIRNGQVWIFGISVAAIIYYFRSGMHHQHNDSIFDILRFVLTDSEEYKRVDPARNNEVNDDEAESLNQRQGTVPARGSAPRRLPYILKMVQLYTSLVNRVKQMPKHETCRHPNSCAHYVLHGGLKMFSIGLGIQISLKLVLQMTRLLANGPKYLKTIFWTKDSLKLAVFLGGFSSTFRLISCLLRHITGKDNALYSIPASLLASLSFASYPDTTVALYVMWKMLQITYNIGNSKGYLPTVPHFTFLLYCASTATLFHAATLEPLNLRPSYWKFLHSLSGGRVAGMDRLALDAYGLETSKQLVEMLKRTKTSMHVRFTL
ncbi:transmembrane protein 135-like [Bradysia coprophila]|uniref:transmembrane protein 135-like n=1 Tax=Bradysia coprophila TaxID=38358 RepID=UPI00187DB84F|nr:transmembrane protein 135-like [Bradysia coprophila]XP_037035409.1 transmembrane protein 135-like [Bradysia coprophila]XP_037035411.1 transmembrane protein 135-like [Bradysia coprophila]XP_037035412.1 transmembrane protein 135-like [Bradysia coprophila]